MLIGSVLIPFSFFHNAQKNRGYNVVVVSDLGLAATPLAGAGIFIDVQEFLTRWNIIDNRRSALLSESPTPKIASSSPSSRTLPSPTTPFSNTFKSPSSPSANDLKAFDSIVEALSNLHKLSHHSSSTTSSPESIHIPTHTVIRRLLLTLVPQILADSEFKSVPQLVEACYRQRFVLEVPTPPSSVTGLPTEVKTLASALRRIARAFVVLPEFQISWVQVLVTAYFPEIKEEVAGPKLLANAVKVAMKKGWLTREAHGGYVVAEGIAEDGVVSLEAVGKEEIPGPL